MFPSSLQGVNLVEVNHGTASNCPASAGRTSLSSAGPPKPDAATINAVGENRTPVDTALRRAARSRPRKISPARVAAPHVQAAPAILDPATMTRRPAPGRPHHQAAPAN